MLRSRLLEAHFTCVGATEVSLYDTIVLPMRRTDVTGVVYVFLDACRDNREVRVENRKTLRQRVFSAEERPGASLALCFICSGWSNSRTVRDAGFEAR